jgi:hypothetical protein
LKSSSERIAAEQKWYALTGRVIELRAEEDGDLHIALADASGDKPGIVVAEIPAKPQWCELRKIVFGWTEVQFPFRVRSGRKLKIRQSSQLSARRFSTSATLPQITPTGELIFKATQHGKFIR